MQGFRPVTYQPAGTGPGPGLTGERGPDLLARARSGDREALDQLCRSAEPLPRQHRQRAEPIVISCPTARQCWAAGFYLTSSGSGVPFMLATRDGGVSCRRVMLPESADSAGVLPTIGLISCPAASRCVAVPFTDPSARRVPVYSLQGPTRS